MKINIIAVGKISQDHLKLIETYKKKIKFYAELNIIEIKEQNNQNISIQKNKETILIKNKIIDNNTYLCSLEGDDYTSLEFSELFKNKENITFVIGGSHGVEEKEFNSKIRFSKMTFPHQLFRVFLVEQIYRGLAINNYIKYHK